MQRLIIIGGILISIALGAGFVLAQSEKKSRTLEVAPLPQITPEQEISNSLPPAPVFTPTHIPTPTPVKAIYVSSWVAATPSIMNRIMNLIDSTEINAVVLDIKDATGRISFLTDHPLLKETGSPENRIKNIELFIDELHKKNIYVIGRISTFQDPYLTKVRPEWAITRKSDGLVWKDRKGLSFLDPANTAVWEYNLALADVSYQVGFDEINFDYIRYPSDGVMSEINYRLTEKPDGTLSTRAEHIEDFMRFINQELRERHPDIVTSADLFGLTTTETTDMGIGQVLEKALPHFDYIGPMIYPSHYAPGSYGITTPVTEPYKVIMRALDGAKKKIDAIDADMTIPEEVRNHVQYSQIRSWIQDFSIGGVTYTADMVRAQIQAVYDSGFDSWMVWDPSNKYTTAAYEPEPDL